MVSFGPITGLYYYFFFLHRYKSTKLILKYKAKKKGYISSSGNGC
jgi:hypothetical protein